MNTLTTNSQINANYEQSVTDIIEMMDKYGFQTEIPFNPKDFREMITKCIRNNIQGEDYNVTYVG